MATIIASKGLLIRRSKAIMQRELKRKKKKAAGRTNRLTFEMKTKQKKRKGEKLKKKAKKSRTIVK